MMPIHLLCLGCIRWLAGASLLALVGWIVPVQAQKAPLRVILPFSAGSGADVMFRSAQAALSKALDGQTVVVENLPGAGGVVGTQALVKAAPDGNTIMIISNNHAVNPSVFKDLPYDSLKDITPITILGGSHFLFVLHPAVPARNAQELQALLHARPNKFNLASSGNGTIIHLAGAMLLDALKGQAQHIPYRGMAPMVTDLMGGQVDMGAAAMSAVIEQVRSGALKPIGVMGATRIDALPEVPTLIEQGFADINITGWIAAVAPKNLPAPQLQRLHQALVAAFNDPGVKRGFAMRSDFPRGSGIHRL